MTVTVELVGEESREIDPDETYADLLAPFAVTRHEVSVLVDGRPVPTDAPVDPDVECMRVVRLLNGG